MKKLVAFLLCALMAVCAMNTLAETTAPLEIVGNWTYEIDLAEWFEYKGGDVDAKIAYEWQFAEDGTFTQKYAEPEKVNAVVKSLMTKIITAEIEAEGVTVSTVATAEGFASVDAFIESIIKKEKLDTFGNEMTIGTYQLEGNVLTMFFTDAEGTSMEAVDTITIVGDTLTLVGVENETLTMTRRIVETAEV